MKLTYGYSPGNLRGEIDLNEWKMNLSYAGLARAAKFDLGVAQFPYFDDLTRAPQNTLPGVRGPGAWQESRTSRKQRPVAVDPAN